MPLTGTAVVDMIVTDLAVFTIDSGSDRPLKLVELAPDVTEEQVREATGAAFVRG